MSGGRVGVRSDAIAFGRVSGLWVFLLHVYLHARAWWLGEIDAQELLHKGGHVADHPNGAGIVHARGADDAKGAAQSRRAAVAGGDDAAHSHLVDRVFGADDDVDFSRVAR